MRPDRAIVESTLEALPEADQDRLAQILDDYLVAVEKGMPISPEELLARHPADAEHLCGYLSGLQLFHAAAVAPQAISFTGGRLQPAQTIGDFRIVREIGRGGMGVVYEAEQVALRRRVALKILPFTVAHDEKQISRFKNEAQAAAHVEHPNIVPVYAVGEQNGVHYYAMQLVEGQSLTALLAELHTGGGLSNAGTTAPNLFHTTHDGETCDTTPAGPQPRRHAPREHVTLDASGTADHVRAIARLGVQAAEALHAAHEYGVVHRDVKPSNLLVDDRGKLWVTDFGLARCRDNAGLTQTGDVLGTMRYMSPEQALGHGELVDHRTDVYSLGVTLYELATLHHPSGDATDAQLLFDRRRFSAKPLRHWNRHIPVDFQTIILKAISEFPHERYGTAQKLADDLGRFLEGKPILASPPGVVSRAGKWARRHRNVVYAAAAVMLVAFVGQSVTMLMLAKQKRETDHVAAISRQYLHQSHEAINRLSDDVADQLAAIPGAEGVRYQLINNISEIYQQFERQAAGESALEADLALAYSKMGSLAERMGKDDEALAKHLAARDIWQRRVAEEPKNVEYTRNLALCHNNVGLLLAELGQVVESLAALEEAERIQLQMLQMNPKIEAVSGDLATTYGNLGLVLKQANRPDQAIGKFRDAIALGEQLKAESPMSEAVLRGLAASYNNLALLLDGPAAEVAAETSIRIQRELVQRNPINRIYQGDLARTYNNLGFALARRQEWRQAELCYRDAVKLQEHLVEESPLAASYRRDLAISYSNLGMVQSRDDRLANAELSFRQALKQQQLLLAVEPSDARTLSNLGGVYNNLGLLFERHEQYPNAESAYEHAIRFQKQAHDSSPATITFRDLLSNHYANYAKCLRAQQKLQAADDVAHQRDALLAVQPKSTNVGP